MKRLLKGVAALGLMATFATTAAHAQVLKGSIGGGITIPTGSTSDGLKTGWNGTAAIQYKPAGSPLGFQVDGMYQQLKATDAVKALDPTADKSEIWSGTGNLVFWFPVAGETKIRPYLLGGGGVYNIKAKPTTGTSVSSTKFGINVGAGFDFDIQDKIGIFVEGRFHNVFVTGSDAKFIPISAGIRFGV